MSSSSSYFNVLQPKKLNTGIAASVVNVKGPSESADELVKLPPLFTLRSPPGFVPFVPAPTTTFVPDGDKVVVDPKPSKVIIGSIPSSLPSFGSITKRGLHTIAKRNARERNRVRMVNQGFQTLRQHIPAGFRYKKMSKVDTLRCALEYIGRLAQLLVSDDEQHQEQDDNNGQQEFPAETKYKDNGTLATMTLDISPGSNTNEGSVSIVEAESKPGNGNLVISSRVNEKQFVMGFSQDNNENDDEDDRFVLQSSFNQSSVDGIADSNNNGNDVQQQ